MRSRLLSRILVTTVVLTTFAAACQSTAPTPAPTSGPGPTSTPIPSDSPVAATAPTALDACDPALLIACDQQAAYLSIPIVDTGLALTWSSQWAPGRKDRAGWDASPLGLGGWALDAVQRYDPTDKALIAGDGSWRFVAGTPLAAGGVAVPTYDGSTAYVFDANGRHVKTVDALLGLAKQTIDYDGSGRLTDVAGTSGQGPIGVTVVRGSDGALQALAGIDGAQTKLLLDAAGHITAVTDPAGHTTSIAYGDGGLVTSETDPLGGVVRFEYDVDGRLTGSTDPDGVTRRFSRTATPASVEVRVTSTLGRATTYGTAATNGGTRRTVTGPDGTTTSEATSADGSIALALPDGTKRTIGAVASSAWGDAARIPTPDVTVRSDGVTSTTEIAQSLEQTGGLPYALRGTISTTVNGDASVADPTSVETVDSTARTLSTVDGADRTSTSSYDEAGRLVAETSPGAADRVYSYDGLGRETSVTEGKGANARTTTFAYDPSTGRATAIGPDGSTRALEVDASGDVVARSAGDGSTAIGGHDVAGRTTRIQPPGGLGTTLGYSPAGRPTLYLPPAAVDDASGETTTYDADGMPTRISGLGDRGVDVTYDDAGRVTGWTVAGGSASATYDATTGVEATASDPRGLTVTYGYASGTPVSLRWSGPLTGSVVDTLDANGRPTSESVDGGPAAVDWRYDDGGALTGLGELSLTRDPASGLATGTQIGAVATRLAYDAAGQLARTVVTAGGPALLDRRLTRDALSRVIDVAETSRTGRTKTAFAYDGAGRLASVRVNGKVVETDVYDPAGNRIRVTTPEGTTRATYDDRDRLVTWGGTTYAWSPDGSLASTMGPQGTTTFDADELGRVRTVHLPSGRSIGYLVDADGRRVGRSVDGSLVSGYLYDPRGQVVAETDGSGSIVELFAYDDLGHLAWVAKGDTTYRVITDQVGSPRLVVDVGNGRVVEALEYDAWGRVTRDTSPAFIPFGFGGGLLDPDTGLVHFGARDYDPATGRWTGPDPIRFAGGDTNLYRYAGGDPVNRADPSGLCPPPGSSEYESSGGPPCTDPPRPDRGSIPPQPPWKPPPSPPPAPKPPVFRCYAAFCSGPPSNNNPQTPTCLFGDCGFGQDGSFSCNQVVFCNGPNGESCYLGSCSYGDTHLQTADGTHLDFQAAGEFLAATSADASLQLEVRQQPVLGGTLITFNTAVAALVDGDRVGIYADEPALLEVNGKPVAAADIEERLTHGGTLERHGGIVTVRWADGSVVTVTRNGATLDMSFEPSTAIRTGLRGLLGDANGDPVDDLTARDGSVLARDDPAFFSKLYAQFGESWRVAPTESLFDYRPGESTAAFTDRNIPSAEVTVDTVPADARAMAQSTCEAAGVRAEPLLDDCLIDVGMTGDAAYAASTAAVAGSGMATGAGSGTGTGQGTGANQGSTPVQLGQAVSGSIAAQADVADYTFIGTSGDVVYLQAHGDCTGSLGWDLVAPDGAGVGGTLACHDLGRQTLTAAGMWTVRINGDRSATGAFAFSVLAVPATVVTKVAPGESESGSLGAPGQQADYTFAGAAGDAVYLQHGSSCTAQVRWEVLAPDGGSGGATSSCQDLDRLDLAKSGTYTIRFSGNGAATGPYAFELLAIPKTAVTPVVTGQTISGSLTAPGQLADYTFVGAAGEVIHPTAHGACVDGLGWKLLGPDAATIDFAVGCRDLGPDTLPKDGTYTIRFDGDRTTVGAYSFTLTTGS